MKTIKKISIKATRVKMEGDPPKRITCSRDVGQIGQQLLGDEDQEVMLVIHLNTKNEIIGYTEVARGSMQQCVIRPADVFRSTLLIGGTALILLHNHPSGHSNPSMEDNTFTKRLKKAGDLLGIDVLDHVIIPSVAEEGTSYFSYLDTGLLQNIMQTED